MNGLTRMRASAIAVSVFCAAVLLLAASGHGIGYNTDSFSYFQGAASLGDSGLLTREYSLVHFPPLLPLILAITGTHPTILLILNMLFLAANVLIFHHLLLVAGVQSAWLRLGAVLVMGVSPVLLLLHGVVQSEPLFLILVQLAVIFLAKDRLGWAALVIAIAPLQRYAGVALIGAGALVILWRYGWWRALGFGLITSGPIGLWMLRNALIADNPGRQITFRGVLPERLLEGAIALAPWLLPLLVIILAAFWLTRHRPMLPIAMQIALVFCGVYLAFLSLSVSFFDHFTPFDFRILSPVILLAWAVGVWWIDSVHLRLIRVGAALLIAGYIALGVTYAATRQPDGLGMIRAVEAEYYDVLASVPDDVTIYSNQVHLVDLMGREAVSPPANLFDPADDERYQADMEVLYADVQAGEAVILWFEDFPRPQLAPPETLKARLAHRSYEGLLVFGNRR